MKQIKTWKDTLAKVKNTEYVLKNGIKVIHTLTPYAQEVVLSIVLKGGAYLDGLIDVPRGTAHFLEHMVLGPNGKFKTQEDIDLFEFGTKNSPAIHFNGGTSEKYVYLLGYSNIKGMKKVFERMETVLGYNTKYIADRIEKERNIILSERIRLPKYSKNKNSQYKKFMIGDILPSNKYSIAGEIKDIKKVSIENLETYYKNALTTNNMVISILSNSKLSPTTKKRLEVLGSLVKRKKKVNIPKVKPENKYKIGHFKDNKEHDIKLSLHYFKKIDKNTDEKFVVLDFMTKHLIQQVGMDILREKLGLVYSFEPFGSSPYIYDYNIYGVSTTVSKKNLLETLNETHDILQKGLESFLYSPKGKTWLESIISKYIYPPTMSYDPDYAENEAVRILEDRNVQLFENSVQAAKQITKESLLKHANSLMKKIPPHIWVVSKYNRSEITKIIKKSKLHKHWN